MTVIEMVAKELRMTPNELEKESLKSYLEKRLSKIESEIFRLAGKFGIRDVLDLDTKLKEGLINEKDSFEDYFTLDQLETEREKLRELLEKV